MQLSRNSFGIVAQLVERLVRIQDARGSPPSIPYFFTLKNLSNLIITDYLTGSPLNEQYKCNAANR